MARRLTLIAGSGALPPLVCTSALGAGTPIQVIDLLGRGDLRGEAVLQLPLARAQAIADAVLAFRSTHLVTAGGVSVSDRDRQAIASALGMPGRLAGSLGDIALAIAFFAHFRLAGVRVVGVHEIVADLLAPPGQIAGPLASAALIAQARNGLLVARAIGRIDLGQAVVLSGDRPVAAEDAEGTDALLERVGRLRSAGGIGGSSTPLILAKALKPRQPKFLDLPTIGPDTITRASAAGINAVVVEAGRSLVLDREELSARAATLGVTVLGLKARRG